MGSKKTNPQDLCELGAAYLRLEGEVAAYLERNPPPTSDLFVDRRAALRSALSEVRRLREGK